MEIIYLIAKISFLVLMSREQNDLHYFINDKNIKAIFCARGGYGTARIVDSVDFKMLQSNPKMDYWI